MEAGCRHVHGVVCRTAFVWGRPFGVGLRVCGVVCREGLQGMPRSTAEPLLAKYPSKVAVPFVPGPRGERCSGCLS